MQIAVIQFPGSTGERETIAALMRNGMCAKAFLWTDCVSQLSQYDGFVIVGGSTYGDLPRPGFFAAQHPIMQQLLVASEKGKPILGIGNGAHILLEKGLVPGVENHISCLALSQNRRVDFDKVLGVGICNRWVFVRPHQAVRRNAFMLGIQSNAIFSLPIVHSHSCFTMDATWCDQLQNKGLVALQYCDRQGVVEASVSTNPSGSIANIAAVMNTAGNVLAMAVHPERSVAGDGIFASMRDYIIEKEVMTPLAKLSVPEKQVALMAYRALNHQWIVHESEASDKASVVQQYCDQRQLPVKVKCFQHWDVKATDAAVTAVESSQWLFNATSSSQVQPAAAERTVYILVQDKVDVKGQYAFQVLANHFEVNGIHQVRSGMLWQLTAQTDCIQDHVEEILQEGWLFHAVSQQAYWFSV